MLSESVAQKPIIPVSAGTKKAKRCPSLGCPALNAEGLSSMGPKPPAFEYAQ